MADARLDLEVVIEGTGAAARGLDGVADSSGRIGRAAGGVAPEVGKLSSAVNGLTRGASAANAAQSAMAQFMAGNFVGAFRSATVAVRGLWTAMWSNPLTAIMAGIALAASAVVLWSNRAKKAAEEAAEKAKEHLDILRQIKEIKGEDPASIRLREVEKYASNPAMVDFGIENEQSKVDYWSAQAESASKAVSVNTDKGKRESLESFRDFALAQLKESQDVLDAWKEAKKNISEAKQLEKETKSEAKPDARETPLERLIRLQLEDIAERAARRDLDRRKSIDKESDPIRKLQMQRKYLLQDMESESDGVKRIAIEEKIYELEKRISEERLRQREQSAEDAKARADAAKAEADAAKAKAAELRAIAGEKNHGDQWGPDVAEGWKIADKKRRTLASGRAGQWFGERNKERLALQGVSLSRTTEMGRPDIGADGKTNPAERTNQLLEKVVERLG